MGRPILSIEEKRKRASARMRKAYATKESVRNGQKSNKLLKAYGITYDEYEEFHKFIGKVCCICENKCPSGRALAVDHDHSNGVIRGLLCVNCNKGLGNFKDNIELLEKAINYLNAYKEALEDQNAINQKSEQEGISKELGDRNARG